MDLLIAPNTVTQAQSDQAPATGTPGWATDGNPATNTPATIFPAYAFNALQAELTAAIQAVGITLDRTKLNQLASALQKMTQGASAITASDTGVANAYAITLAPAPSALTPGMIVVVESIVSGNNGAATLDVNGLGALPIELPGAQALKGGELVASYGAILRLNHTGTAWILLHSTGLDRQLGGAGQSWQDVHASRALGTPYTNNTGRPIQVIVSANSASASALMTATIGGVSIQGPAQSTAGINASMSFVVPNGVAYSVSMVGSTTLAAWAELR